MKGQREGNQGLSFSYAIMQPPPVCILVVGMRASGILLMFSRGLFARWQCALYPLLVRMPQRAAQSLATRVSVRKRISGL